MKWMLAILATLLVGPQINVVGQDPIFTAINLEKEIPGIQVNKLLQDDKGFILLGTNRGLYRFDGQLIIPVPQRPGLEVDISSIFLSQDSIIWVGCSNGTICRVMGDSLVNVEFDGETPGVAITAITETRDNITWFGTYGEGIYYWNGKSLLNINADDGLPDNYIYDLVSDGRGYCWAGQDQGLIQCSLENEQKHIRHFGLHEGLPDLIIKSLSLGDDGQIWFGTYENGIGKIDPESFSIWTPDNSTDWIFGPVEDLLPYGDLCWVATISHGILELGITGEPFTLEIKTREKTFYKIADLLLDDQMNIWAASNSYLLRSGGRAFSFYATNHETEAFPTAILKYGSDKTYVAYDNELWLHSTQNNGAVISQRIGLSNQINSIISMYKDVWGYIWIGTFGNGMVIYDPVGKREKLIDEESGLQNGNILSIDGRDQSVWLATLGGATCINMNSPNGIFEGSYQIIHYDEDKGIGNNFIYKVYIDSQNRVWFGTDGKGVYVLENNQINHIHSSGDHAQLVVYSITEDAEGSIWFSTASDEIYKVSKSVAQVVLGAELTNSKIRGLIADKQGNILIVSDPGIDVFDIAENHLSPFPLDADIDISGANLNAICMIENIALVGTAKGILEINTDYMPASFVPKSVIRDFKVNMLSRSLSGEIRLKHDENFVGIEYSGLWFAHPEKVVYQVLLEGHDHTWLTTKNKQASYANLSPGDYTFLIRSSLDGNFDLAEVSSLQFSISKPFWATAWFYTLAALVILSIVFLIIKIRERNYKRIKSLEKEKIIFEFETLKSQVNPHFLFNSFSTLSSLIEDDKKIAIDYVEKLSDFFRGILENRDKDLVSLSEELILIRNYVDIQKKRFGEALTLIDEIPSTLMDSKVPPLVLQLLIENAIKHNIISRSRPLKVWLLATESGEIIVKNNFQPKRNKQVSTSIGLENIRERYRLLAKKEISVKKNDEYFIVELPALTN